MSVGHPRTMRDGCAVEPTQQLGCGEMPKRSRPAVNSSALNGAHATR